MFQGISLDQAPPFSVPVRFFLTAPLFLMLSGVLMLLGDPSALESRWSYPSLALVHALTIGFGGMVMLGALTQMLPVLAGVKLRSPLKLARIVHSALSFGTLAMIFGFWFSSAPLLFLALGLLGAGFGLFLFGLGYELFFRVAFVNSTIKAMRYAVVALVLVVLSGGMMLGLHALGISVPWQMEMIQFHLKAGSLGWTFLLILGVSFQVIPMFYVTQEYPLWLREKGVKLFVGVLLLSLGMPWLLGGDEGGLLDILAILAILWSAFTLKNLASRKRALADTTIRYWQISSLSLILFGLLFLLSPYLSWDSSSWLFLLFAYGFGVSLINGMLYKIIPFLVWFHLSGAGVFMIPSMREMIEEKRMLLQLFLHLLAGIALGAGMVQSLFFYPAGLLLLLSNGLLGYNLYKASQIYYANLPKGADSNGMEKD